MVSPTTKYYSALFIFWFYICILSLCFISMIVDIIYFVFINWGWDCSSHLYTRWNFYGHILSNFLGCNLFKVKSVFFLFEIPLDITFIIGCVKAKSNRINKKWIYLCGLFVTWYLFSINYFYFTPAAHWSHNLGFFLILLLIPGLLLNLKYAGVRQTRATKIHN